MPVMTELRKCYGFSGIILGDGSVAVFELDTQSVLNISDALRPDADELLAYINPEPAESVATGKEVLSELNLPDAEHPAVDEMLATAETLVVQSAEIGKAEVVAQKLAELREVEPDPVAAKQKAGKKTKPAKAEKVKSAKEHLKDAFKHLDKAKKEHDKAVKDAAKKLKAEAKKLKGGKPKKKSK